MKTFVGSEWNSDAMTGNIICSPSCVSSVRIVRTLRQRISGRLANHEDLRGLVMEQVRSDNGNHLLESFLISSARIVRNLQQMKFVRLFNHEYVRRFRVDWHRLAGTI